MVEAALDIAHGMPAEQIRNPAVFGPEIEPAPDASPADRFAAFLGRAAAAAAG